MKIQTSSAAEKTSPPRGLNRLVYFLGVVLNPLTRFAGIVACILLAFLVLLTFADVIGHVLFHKPITGYLDLTQYGMVLITGFGLSCCAMKKKHIRVDIVNVYLPHKVNERIDIYVNLIACIFYGLITWQTCVNGIENINSGLTSGILLIPAYPFYLMLVIGTAFLTLVFLRDFLQSVSEVSA